MSLNKAYVSSTQVASSTPFDNTTGKGYVGSDVQTALEELRDHTIYDSQTQATTLNGTLTLTISNKTLQYLTGTATGYTVVLPDATTLVIGQNYLIDNTSTQDVTIKDGGGNILFVLGQSSEAVLKLQLNPNAAGTWSGYQNLLGFGSGVVTYNIVSSTTFSSSANADTLITGMSVTPQAGTYGIWYNAANSGTGSGQQLDCTIYAGAAAITDSIRSNLSTSGTHVFQNSTQTIHTFDGLTTCSIKVNPNGNSMSVGNISLLMIRFGV